MVKKISLLTILGVFFSFSALAVPNEAEFGLCLKKNATDAGLTECYKKETEVVKNEIKTLENALQPIAIADNVTITTLKGYISEYIKSYCDYYILAHSGDGYSNSFHSAKCYMLGYMQYYRNLQSLYGLSISDIKE